MARPDTVVGLTVELIRRRGIPRWAFAVAAASVVTLGALAVGRGHPATTSARVTREWAEWSAVPLDGETIDVDPAVVETASGWLVAWSRWERGRSPAVLVASLGRDGILRGRAQVLSAPGTFARQPRLARDRARVAVAWTARDEDDREWNPRPWLAVIDADAKVLVPARRVGGDAGFGYRVSVASDGQGWGLGWTALARDFHGVVLARLSPEGEPRGPFTRTPMEENGGDSELAWVGDAWIFPVVVHEYECDRSALRVMWFDRGGRLVESRRVAPSRGDAGALRVAARASTAWVTWGEDSAFGVRHDPRLVAFEGRRVVAGPVAVGPRRSGDVPSLACAATDCVSAWVGVPEEGDQPPILHAQVFDPAGVPRGDERRIGPGATLSQLGSAAVARSIDEREALAVWTHYTSPRGLLMAVRLGPDGAPLAPPVALSLP